MPQRYPKLELTRVDLTNDTAGLPPSLIAAMEADGGLWWAGDAYTTADQVVETAGRVGALALRLDLRDLALLAALPGIRYLHLRSDGRPRLDAVARLTGLRALIIHTSGWRDELDPVGFPDLHWLRLSLGGKGGATVSPGVARGHPRLEWLALQEAAVTPGLEKLTLDLTQIRTVDGLAGIHRLETLELIGGRVRDLAPLRSIILPDGPRGEESMLTAEPRVLADGHTVLVSTFACGLYLMENLEGAEASARLVASFPRKEGSYCAIPVVSGRFYLVTVPALSAVVSLDIGDPSAPREVSRVALGPEDVPHWIAISPDHRRLVITGYRDMKHRVMLARFDSATGQLAIDERFREPNASDPGFRMDDKTWPHGGNAKAIPHGAVFSRP